MLLYMDGKSLDNPFVKYNICTHTDSVKYMMAHLLHPLHLKITLSG